MWICAPLFQHVTCLNQSRCLIHLDAQTCFFFSPICQIPDASHCFPMPLALESQEVCKCQGWSLTMPLSIFWEAGFESNWNARGSVHPTSCHAQEILRRKKMAPNLATAPKCDAAQLHASGAGIWWENHVQQTNRNYLKKFLGSQKFGIFGIRILIPENQ